MYINEAFKTKKPRELSFLAENKSKPTLAKGEEKVAKLCHKDPNGASQEKIQIFLKEQPDHEKNSFPDSIPTVWNEKEDKHSPSSMKKPQIDQLPHTKSCEKGIPFIETPPSYSIQQPVNNPSSSSWNIHKAPEATAHVNCSNYSSSTQEDNNNEWIKYDKSLLPDHFSFLLDVLQGLESAWILLRSRRQLVLFSRVQPIVQRTLKRTLHYKHVCQIANLCPDLLKLSKWKESSDDVELIICDVSQLILQGEATNAKTAIAARRILLHRKLVECFEQGMLQLDTNDPCKSQNNQQDETNCSQFSFKRSNDSLQGKDDSLPKKFLKTDDIFDDNKPTQLSLKDSSISEKLLKKVRERERRETQQATMKEQQREQIVLSRLPKLADAIRSIFISSKKTVLPFDLLLQQLKGQEMIPFSQEEFSEQIYEIVKRIPQWLQIEENRNIKVVKWNNRIPYFSLRKQLTATSIP
ncbi:hypothetical protein Gasu2_13080 [Galdieria sulphuraria]|uniref:DNA replication factor Cdt1, putative n=1 Tax=Galdieria sulphuraria TaxID=130081 RepID=M2XZA7_GALSU|nr:DNA replication factor Cdt1, putative [Galdieria sulphuraria]EME28983.1 DNA replication factor Cdt1, putative [Galdieria sulphuraria]GJD06920.1 hypothetical protein Gasu2_13080 [Galdieria sulphuraria]|eukprot:XP_005705503.1 DNA replication factor Cdt1, putative [Galdieria sulphuraria]